MKICFSKTKSRNEEALKIDDYDLGFVESN